MTVLRTQSSFLIIFPLVLLMINPAYAAVTSVSLKEDVYSNEAKFAFVGKESDGSKSIFVIIRGSSGKYLGMVSDPVSNPDGSFETIPRPVKDFFKSAGTFNATAFSDDQQESEGIFILLQYDGNQVSLLPTFVLEIELNHSLDNRDKNSGSDSNFIALPVTISLSFDNDVDKSPM